jgi:RNA polymerase sigma factor (sigma-70 family)
MGACMHRNRIRLSLLKSFVGIFQQWLFNGEMQPPSDAQLLRDYAERGAEAAFAEIVARHTDLVYSAALRQVYSPDLARDVTQSVFSDLTRKARTLSANLSPEASLVGWLYRGTRFAARDLYRNETRRTQRERQAMEQFLSAPETAPDWEQLRPVLDDAMSELDDTEREAVLLRYFKNHDFRTVGATLGISDDAAQKRVSRAVERLREFFARRGVTVGASGLVVVISANAVQAAPVGLALTISTAAMTGTTLATTAAITTIKTIAMTTTQKTLVTVAIAVLAGAAIYEARQAAQLRAQVQTLQQQQAPVAGQVGQLRRERAELANRLSALADQLEKGKANFSELLGLRGEAARLRSDSRELAEMKAAESSDPAATEMKSWLARVKQLRQAVENDPRVSIPEFSLLTENDWLMAAKWYGRRPQFDAETDLRVALAELRQSGQNTFATRALQALQEFAKANDGHFPSDPNQLKPYFIPPVDDAVLQRYTTAPAEEFGLKTKDQDHVLTQKTLVDEKYDKHIGIGQKLWGYKQSIEQQLEKELTPELLAFKRTLDPVAKNYSAANDGRSATDPSQLLPYIKTAEQQAALQKFIEFRNSNSQSNK